MSFLDDGYNTLKDVVPVAECDQLAARADSIRHSSVGSRCLLDHEWCRQAGRVIRSYLATRLQAAADKVIVQCTYFHKTESKNWFVAWHQDRSVPVASRVQSTELSGWSEKEGMTFLHAPDTVLSEMVAARLHLDDSTIHNGPLRVIAGSHRHGMLTQDQIEQVRKDTQETTCVVGKGGLILMRPNLLHASSKSTSTEPRRVLHFLFAPRRLPHGLEWRYAV